ncbi:MAG TPA: hypothetical protein VHO48_09425 [Anaerolineaceae bacterium]|nr:hypothetical protein [Anaerolineaceae bacterium]
MEFEQARRNGHDPRLVFVHQFRDALLLIIRKAGNALRAVSAQLEIADAPIAGQFHRGGQIRADFICHNVDFHI